MKFESSEDQHMNNYPESRTSGEPAGTPIAWKLSFAAALVMGCVSGFTLVLFPIHNGPLTIIASKLGLIGAARHFPEGQLQADAKTAVAELKWIFAPELGPTTLPTMVSTNQPVTAREVSEVS